MAENLAYDLAKFENRDKKLKALPKVKPAPQPKTRLQTALSLIFGISVAICVGVVVSVSIYSRVILSETVNQITDAKRELTALQSEQTRLSMQLDSKISLQNVETYASDDLGLSRMDKYQIAYVTMSGDDMIANTEERENKSLSDIINGLFYKLVEYIN